MHPTHSISYSSLILPQSQYSTNKEPPQSPTGSPAGLVPSPRNPAPITFLLEDLITSAFSQHYASIATQSALCFNCYSSLSSLFAGVILVPSKEVYKYYRVIPRRHRKLLKRYTMVNYTFHLSSTHSLHGSGSGSVHVWSLTVLDRMEPNGPQSWVPNLGRPT